jgi:hypothetical protein
MDPVGHSGGVDRAAVLSAYREGVSAAQATVEGWSVERWSRPACGVWTGTDLAGHLLRVAAWYHEWLDRAESGDPRPPFDWDQLAERNRQELLGLRPATGPDRISLFVEEAERYAERLDSSWGLAYGCPMGTMTAGQHAALAAAEWHLHTWDLAAGRHRPADPATLLVGAIRARAAAGSGLRPRVESVVAPMVAWRHPWRRLLAASGRHV